METSKSHLLDYVQHGFKEVEGWVLPAAVTALEAFDNITRSAGVTVGGACEIGVHHGRFFLALLSCIGPQEKSLAIDIFEDQILNVDRSGKGSKSQFLQNVARFSHHVERVETMHADSLTLNSKELVDMGSRFLPFRFFSVDGGHTAVHAFNDLLVAQDLITNGGIVMVDDFFQPDWPGVTEGVARYYSTANTKLAPLCIAGGKLFMTTFSYHTRYLQNIRNQFLGDRPKSIVKSITIHGHAAISFRLHHEDPMVLAPDFPL